MENEEKAQLKAQHKKKVGKFFFLNSKAY